MRNSAVLGFLLLILSVGSVHAGTLASGFVVDNTTPATAFTCILSNIGTKAVGIVSTQIFDTSGNDITGGSNCPSSLVGGASCFVQAASSNGRAVIQVVGGTKQLRATCELFSSTKGLLGVAEMR